MHTLQMKKQVDADGHLRLDIPLSGNEKQVNIVLVTDFAPSTLDSHRGYSDLVGKLRWRGNAVATQRKMRDEWQ